MLQFSSARQAEQSKLVERFTLVQHLALDAGTTSTRKLSHPFAM